MTAPHAHDTSLFLNRELSWLAFNERVLEEAADTGTPLLDRVKFAAIAASNLDEFFMVRVAGLQQAVDIGETLPAIIRTKNWETGTSRRRRTSRPEVIQQRLQSFGILVRHPHSVASAVKMRMSGI